MSSESQKIVKVHLVQTPLKTVKSKLLVRPEKKEKYDLEKVIKLMSPRVPFMDEAILAILIRTFHEKVIELASEGYHIDTELVSFRPAITGTVPSERITLKDNKLKVVAIPGKALRTCVSKTKLRIARNDYPNRYILDVENAFDSQSPVTEKGYIKLFGRNLKVMGDFPECGVWFDNNDTKQRFHVNRISKMFNKPKSLFLQLPDDLPAGIYYISVVTCYCGTKRLLSDFAAIAATGVPFFELKAESDFSHYA